nr:hypothetical protein [Tanacetum cinerariifolium]
MATTPLSARPTRASLFTTHIRPHRPPHTHTHTHTPSNNHTLANTNNLFKSDRLKLTSSRRRKSVVVGAGGGSTADEFEMSYESALKLLGVSEGASFDDILRAKNSVLASCKDDQDSIAQVSQ